MLDLNNLSIFTPSNGIYGGVNTTNFKSIELWIQAIKETPKVIPSKPDVLGLFGPASTGKTTAAGIVAKALNQPLVSLNCASLNQSAIFESIYNNTVQLFPDNNHIHLVGTPKISYYGSPDRMYGLQNCTVLLDECHELTTRSQGQLLSVLDGSLRIVNDAIQKQYPLAFSKVTWILSTTDSGKLLYPLSTRLHSIVLNEYSESDLVEIVKLSYPVLGDEPSLVLSRAAKLVPRLALDLAKQYISIFKSAGYTRETALTYVGSIRQTNEYGLDTTDNKILSFLRESKTPLSKAHQIDKNIIEHKLAKFDSCVDPSQEDLTEAINLQNTLIDYVEYEDTLPQQPRSRQDIATYCRLYDLRDLEMRLGYMEKLGVIIKTKSGVMWKHDIT